MGFGASGGNGGCIDMGIAGAGVAQRKSVGTMFGLIFGAFGNVLGMNVG